MKTELWILCFISGPWTHRSFLLCGAFTRSLFGSVKTNPAVFAWFVLADVDQTSGPRPFRGRGLGLVPDELLPAVELFLAGTWRDHDPIKILDVLRKFEPNCAVIGSDTLLWGVLIGCSLWMPFAHAGSVASAPVCVCWLLFIKSCEDVLMLLWMKFHLNDLTIKTFSHQKFVLFHEFWLRCSSSGFMVKADANVCLDFMFVFFITSHLVIIHSDSRGASSFLSSLHHKVYSERPAIRIM